jgi:hypothetical protein
MRWNDDVDQYVDIVDWRGKLKMWRISLSIDAEQFLLPLRSP